MKIIVGSRQSYEEYCRKRPPFDKGEYVRATSTRAIRGVIVESAEDVILLHDGKLSVYREALLYCVRPFRSGVV